MPRTKGSVFYTLITVQNGEINTVEVRGFEAAEAKVEELRNQGFGVTLIRGRIEGTFTAITTASAVGA
jgi:hypothetical protein